jgi:hypothetical protein
MTFQVGAPPKKWRRFIAPPSRGGKVQESRQRNQDRVAAVHNVGDLSLECKRYLAVLQHDVDIV